MEVRLVCRLQPKVHWVPEIYYKFGTLSRVVWFVKGGLVWFLSPNWRCGTAIRGKDYGRGFLEKEAFLRVCVTSRVFWGI